MTDWAAQVGPSARHFARARPEVPLPEGSQPQPVAPKLPTLSFQLQPLTVTEEEGMGYVEGP